MKEEIRNLKNEFERIKNKGYIKGITNSYSSIGRTFENELNLPENTFSVPDYYGIELKARRTYSKSAITLFNIEPDGESLFEIERLKDTYGYPYKNDRNYKALYIEAYGNKLNYAGIKFQYKLEIDKENQKVYLCVFNKYGAPIERKVYWSFEYLKTRLYTKLKYMAVINTWTNKIENWNYFKYHKMDIYKLKDFEIFISLIQDGTIKICIKIDIHLGKTNYGKTYNHGCGFAIEEKNLSKLFYKYEES